MSTYSDGVLALSPLLYWRLGESVGPTAADASGNGRTGTYQSSVTLGQPSLLVGDADTCILNPTNDVNAGVKSTYNPFGAGSLRTFVGWCVRTDTTTNDMVVCGDGANAPFLNCQSGSSDVVWNPGNTGSQTWTAALPTGSTVMWALTYNDSSLVSELFINGVSQGTRTSGAAYGTTGNVWAYGAVFAAGNAFGGKGDEFAVFGSILSAANILDLYQRGTATGPYAPPPPPAPPPSAAKPPLGLIAEVTLADGSRYRWDSGARSAVDRPQGITFRTKKGDGFADGGLNLSRRIDQDYIDLNLYDDFSLVGYDGAIAYEGRVAAVPRSLGSVHQVGVVLQGWMSHARDRKFVEVFVDRDSGAWGNFPLARRAAIVADVQTLSWATEDGGLICHLEARAHNAQTETEAWYIAPSGLTVGKVMYLGNDNGMPAGWEAPTLFAGNDAQTGSDGSVAMTLDSTLRTATPTVARRNAFLRVYTNASANLTPGTGAYRRLSALGVYGNHGLTTRTIDSTNPDGVFASDVITNIAQRFCPKLSTAGVQATSYPIPHLVFKDPTDPYDAFLDVNKYHLWNLAVYEGKTLFFKPFDYTDYDWEVRLSDLGTTMDLQGDAVGQFANGIAVNYTDVQTGLPARITPSDDSTLLDTTVTNPANAHGLTVWHEESMSVPTTATGATQFGRAALAEFNQPKAPGTITVQGHIRDRAGHWQQGWKVRAGDRIAITDHPNDRVRLVVETEWNHDSKTLTMAVDQSFMRLDAVVDRIQTALVANNLT